MKYNRHYQQKFYSTKEFQELNKEWRKKLEDSGFEDLENGKHEYGILPKSIKTTSNNFITRELTESYYDKVNDYLHNGHFRKDSERQIWELYANGLSLEEIRHRMKFNTIENVRYHLKKIKKRMKLR